MGPRGRRSDGGLPGSVAGVAASVLGAVRDVPAGTRRVWRRRDGTRVSRHDQPHRGSDGARADGAGSHPLHGQGVGSASQPRGQHRVLATRRLPVEARAGIHRRAADRRGARRLVRTERDQRLGGLRLQLPGSGLLGTRRVPDGSRAHARTGQRDPRNRVRCAEPGRLRRARGRRLHHPRRTVGESDLRRLDEPGAHVRARPRRRELHQLLGVHRRPARRRMPGRGCRIRLARARRRAWPGQAPPREPSTPRPKIQTRRRPRTTCVSAR